MVDLLLASVMGTPVWQWGLFAFLILALLVFDLGVLNKDDHEIGFRESIRLSVFYIAISCAFGVWLWFERGGEDGMHFFTAYVIEKSLSLDNIFVMSMIFAYFGIPRKYQHRVLFWGILGVIILRGIMIAAGAAIITHFHWVLLLFAAFLIITGIKMVMMSKEDAPPDLNKSKLILFLRKHLNMAPMLHGHNFFVRLPRGGKPHVLHATPLFLTLVCIEIADLLFALDSVPAVFAITTDTYVVFTSNIFAILGLRALYFALAAILHRFEYMKYALSIILIFIGAKAFYAHFFDKVPASVSLSITLGLLAAGFIYSLYKTRRNAPPLPPQN